MPAPATLRPGDVLLYPGEGIISWAIRFFDSRPDSHVGVYMGDLEVREAIASGVERTGCDASVQSAQWVEHSRLKGDPATRYAYEQIVLLVLLTLTRKLKTNRSSPACWAQHWDRGARLLTQWASGGKEPMICSEFVFRSYEEARPASYDPYTMRVAPWAAPFGAQTPATPQIGRGVHRDSLVARFATTSMAPGHTPAIVAAASESAEAAEGAANELEAALEEYRRVIEAPEPEAAALPGPEADAPIRSPEIYAWINRFLATYATAVHIDGAAPEGLVAGSAGSLESMDLVGAVLRPVADCVTPGDLYDCDNLQNMGRMP